MTESKFNILYIDTSQTDLELFKAQFENDYNITTVDDPDEAREILKLTDIQLMISEQELPNTTGIEFFESLNNSNPDLIKVILTHFRNADQVITALNTYQVHKFIIKPYDKFAIEEIIDDALQIYLKKQKNRKTLFELRHLLDEMNLVYEVSLKISEKKPLGKLLTEIMESCKTVMNAEASSLLLYDPEDEQLHFQVATGSKGMLVKKYSVSMGEGIAGWVAKNQESQLIEDCYQDPRFNREFDLKSDFHTRSMICVPLVRKEKLLGVIQVINKIDGKVFTESDLRIFSTLASQCAISIENAQLIESQIEAEALERELQTAREIQNQLLPSSLPEFDDLDIATRLIPARLIGGDYYNVIKINDHQSLLFISDVSGKGIPAALIVSTIYSCLETYLDLRKEEFDLLSLVTSLNKALISSTPLDKYATCWFGLYDHTKKKLISLNAGHNPPYIFHKKDKKPIELNTGGIILGIMEFLFETEEIDMQLHDVLVFFTDGVTEALNKQDEEYGEARLIDVVNRNQHKPATEIINEIEEDVKKHVSGAPQSDDFTCVVAKIL